MSARLEALEERVEQLEALVSQLVAEGLADDDPDGAKRALFLYRSRRGRGGSRAEGP